MNRSLLISFAITGLLVGMLVTWQFNTSIPVSTSFLSDEVEAKDELLKAFLNEQSYLQQRIVTLRQQINESQLDVEMHAEASSLALLEELKGKVGLTEMVGDGIEIILDDNPSAIRDGADVTDSQLVQASDIRDIVNFLLASNATAVSINKQRIIATSPISAVGTSILVNNAHISPPFVISAIGDNDLILQRYHNKDILLAGVFNRLEKDKIFFDAVYKQKIIMPIYNGDLKIKYLNLVE